MEILAISHCLDFIKYQFRKFQAFFEDKWLSRTVRTLSNIQGLFKTLQTLNSLTQAQRQLRRTHSIATINMHFWNKHASRNLFMLQFSLHFNLLISFICFSSVYLRKGRNKAYMQPIINVSSAPVMYYVFQMKSKRILNVKLSKHALCSMVKHYGAKETRATTNFEKTSLKK